MISTGLRKFLPFPSLTAGWTILSLTWPKTRSNNPHEKYGIDLWDFKALTLNGQITAYITRRIHESTIGTEKKSTAKAFKSF